MTALRRFSSRSTILTLTAGFLLGLVPSFLWFSFITGFGHNDVKQLGLPDHILGSSLRNIEAVRSRSFINVPQVKPNDPALQKPKFGVKNKTRKFLLDCGANVASTVLLFRETYPGGRDFTIHSFEIDDRLAPYFSPYDKHELHCPVGVAGKNGNMTAFSEMVWGPKKGLSHGVDMQWGGGSLFVTNNEKKDDKTGGFRKLSYRKTIPVIDLSQWITKTFSKDDYIILKLDVEGAEYEILRKMLNDKAFDYIDKFYGEYHDRTLTGWTLEEKNRVRKDVDKLGYRLMDWAGELRTYDDIEELNPIKVADGTPGKAGLIYSNCEHDSVALTVAIGMNHERAHRVVSALTAYKPLVSATLFVYGDFVKAFPETVKSWAEHFDIGMREDGHNPPGHLELISGNWIRMGLISTILRLDDIGITTSYYLPTVVGKITSRVTEEAEKRGLRTIKPAAEFPPRNGAKEELTWDNYYRFRDVERVPKALRRIHDILSKNHGGILTVDTDLPDTYMISVFMMDYLVQTSGFKLVNLSECIAKSQ